jgi:hypothetical protein
MHWPLWNMPFSRERDKVAMNDRSYWKLGERFAKAWNIGNELKNR